MTLFLILFFMYYCNFIEIQLIFAYWSCNLWPWCTHLLVLRFFLFVDSLGQSMRPSSHLQIGIVLFLPFWPISILFPFLAFELCRTSSTILNCSSKNYCQFCHFPGGSVVKTSSSNAGGAGLIPGWGAKIPHTSWQKKKKKVEQK